MTKVFGTDARVVSTVMCYIERIADIASAQQCFLTQKSIYLLKYLMTLCSESTKSTQAKKDNNKLKRKNYGKEKSCCRL
jgi:hypothetical protein